MKKFVLIGAIGLSLTALTAFTSMQGNENNSIENRDCTYGRCSAIKSDGYQCKNCAQQNSAYCWSHSK